jgi:hypothetical protein
VQKGTPLWGKDNRRGRWSHICPEDGGGSLVVTRAQLGIYRITDDDGKTIAWEADEDLGCQWCGELPPALEPFFAVSGMSVPVGPGGVLLWAAATPLADED